MLLLHDCTTTVCSREGGDTAAVDFRRLSFDICSLGRDSTAPILYRRATVHGGHLIRRHTRRRQQQQRARRLAAGVDDDETEI